MTENNFSTYQQFNNKLEAEELIELLTRNKIEFLFENTSEHFDPSFSFNELNKKYLIKIKKQDIEQVDQLILDISRMQITDVDKNHYLFEFSNPELIDVLTKKDEWCTFDYLLAQKILKERGLDINDASLETSRKQRMEALAKPEEVQKIWLIAAYLFAFLGGLLGLIIGWHLLSYKKTLPNGDVVSGYTHHNRKHGKIILIVSIIFIMIWITTHLFINN